MSSNRLPILIGEIEHEHQAAIGSARSAIEHAVRCGQLLIEAKASIGHGGWLPWVKANLTFGDRQAQKYMRLADHSDQIRTESSHLSINEALELARKFSGEESVQFVNGVLDAVRRELGEAAGS